LKKLYVDFAAVAVVLGSAAYVLIKLGWTAIDLAVAVVMGLFWYLKYKPMQSACTVAAGVILITVIYLSYEIYTARRRA
jgi:hypothetical protein